MKVKKVKLNNSRKTMIIIVLCILIYTAGVWQVAIHVAAEGGTGGVPNSGATSIS